MNEPSDKQKARGCRHFTGIQHDACDAGIAYKQFLYENFPNFPCHSRMDGTFSGACSSFEWRTEAELVEEEQKIADAVSAWVTSMTSKTCPECGAKVEHERQVGRCVYGDPCGHRLYQGTVGAFKDK